MTKKDKPQNKRKFFRGMTTDGFSLIELIVTIGIFTAISGLLLANYGSFSSKAVLNNLGHEVAQAVREAQVYGISVREFGAGSDDFPSYGVNFTSADPDTFLIFADTNGDGDYTTNELLETFSLRGNNTISKLCGFVNTMASCTPLSELNIMFTRPDPDATILGTPGGQPYAYTKVTVSSSAGDTSVITVWSSGQISVQ